MLIHVLIFSGLKKQYKQSGYTNCTLDSLHFHDAKKASYPSMSSDAPELQLQGCVSGWSQRRVGHSPRLTSLWISTGGARSWVVENPMGYGCFLQWWYPTTMGFPTKNDHFGVFWWYHCFRKHPICWLNKAKQIRFSLLENGSEFLLKASFCWEGWGWHWGEGPPHLIPFPFLGFVCFLPVFIYATGLHSFSNERLVNLFARSSGSSFKRSILDLVWVVVSNTPPKTNIDTENHVFLKVPPFKYGYFGYPCISMLVFGSVCFIFTPIPGKMIQFDEHNFFRWVGSTTN